jgi:hypothetical protein
MPREAYIGAFGAKTSKDILDFAISEAMDYESQATERLG